MWCLFWKKCRVIIISQNHSDCIVIIQVYRNWVHPLVRETQKTFVLRHFILSTSQKKLMDAIELNPRPAYWLHFDYLLPTRQRWWATDLIITYKPHWVQGEQLLGQPLSSGCSEWGTPYSRNSSDCLGYGLQKKKQLLLFICLIMWCDYVSVLTLHVTADMICLCFWRKKEGCWNGIDGLWGGLRFFWNN